MKRAMVLVAAVLLLALAAVFVTMWRSVPPLSGTERVAGLGAEVTVTFDSLAIPHIAASSDTDAFFALGLLHARERLFSMDIMRRAAEGRLSEVMGGATLPTDRYLRSLDIPRAAARSFALVPPSTRAILDAYVRGVNAWITGHDRPLPPEFLILRYRPEPWTATQVFELARLMSWDLRAGSNDLAYARIAAEAPERVPSLFPPGDTTALIIPRLTEAEIPRVPELASEILDLSSISRASNSWVIAGSRTASGKPIVANDPHLGLRAPSLWYLAVISSPGYHAGGTTIPGVPGIILGHNQRIAWGWTNGSVDDADYVIERLSRDTSRVLTTTGWQPVEQQRDSIRIRGRAAVPFTLYRTAHGPLVDGAPPGTPRDTAGELRMVALKWVGHDASDDLSAILALDRAGSWDDFLGAARGLHSPEQNWIYADVDGNIGYTLAGAVPVRAAGNGLLPTPGWTDEGRWTGYLAFEDLPRIYNPPEGYIVTANNRIAGPEYKHFISADWELPYRAQRIREMLTAHRHPLTVADVQSMQMDTLDVFARWAKEIAAQAAADANRPGLADTLRRWDGTMGSDRYEPTLFWNWYRELRAVVARDQPDPFVPSAVFHAALHDDSSLLFDDPRTPARETLREDAAAALRASLQVPRRRWGDVHVTVSGHTLGTVKPLDVLLRLNVGPAPRAGSGYTVNVADFSSSSPDVRVNRHAASFRQVVDLAKPDEAWVILTTGESGNPLSRHYRDQRASWWSGRLARVALSGSAGTTLRLAPR